ncbi:MAG: hypothetical protein K0Q53_97 [Massilibacillus sp.]|jgi:hypothetical protein|nr:hypothetical protein [Massilibacillus sp.]
MKHKVICVDFDNTIAKVTNYPIVDGLIQESKEILTKYHAKGGQIVIWTCRTGIHLQDAVIFLRENNIPFDSVNRYLPWQIEEYRNSFPDVEPDGRKICADMYIDDKNPGGIDWNLIKNLLEVE